MQQDINKKQSNQKQSSIKHSSLSVFITKVNLVFKLCCGKFSRQEFPAMYSNWVLFDLRLFLYAVVKFLYDAN